MIYPPCLPYISLPRTTYKYCNANPYQCHGNEYICQIIPLSSRNNTHINHHIRHINIICGISINHDVNGGGCEKLSICLVENINFYHIIPLLCLFTQWLLLHNLVDLPPHMIAYDIKSFLSPPSVTTVTEFFHTPIKYYHIPEDQIHIFQLYITYYMH